MLAKLPWREARFAKTVEMAGLPWEKETGERKETNRKANIPLAGLPWVQKVMPTEVAVAGLPWRKEAKVQNVVALAELPWANRAAPVEVVPAGLPWHEKSIPTSGTYP